MSKMVDFIEFHVLPGAQVKLYKVGQIKGLEKHDDYTAVSFKDGTTVNVLELYSWIISKCASTVIRYENGKTTSVVHKWEPYMERRHWPNGRERSGQTF